MFIKPFRIKSNVAMKNSDKKRLRTQVKPFFPDDENLDETLKTILPSKEEISCVKTQLHKGNVSTVYCAKKNPIFFEFDGRIFPALTTVWVHSLKLPLMSTQLPVISKLANGADFMLPGIVFPTDLNEFPQFERGSVVGINTTDNLSCLAVGVANMSSAEMCASVEKRGKAVQIIHIFGDNLWSMGDKIQPPQLKPDTQQGIIEAPLQITVSAENDCQVDIDTIKLESDISGVKIEVVENEAGSEQLPSEEVNTEDVEEEMTTEEMDALLELCFLTGLKSKLKDKELPILASSFYRLHVLPSCPPDQHLEIKKTSYKKLGKYLKHVASLNLISVKELSKGNDNIVLVNRAHEMYRSFKVTQQEDPTPDSSVNTELYCGVITQKQYEPPEISTVYRVNSNTLQLFESVGLPKGSVLSAQDVRQQLTQYIKENELGRGRKVLLDPILHKIACGSGNADIEELSWEDVFKRTLGKMQLNHKICFKGTPPIVKKGEPPVITISTQVRSGNKKVTLVRNLEAFYIDPQQFADTIRKVAQASTSLSNVAGSNPKTPLQQVLVQGNQVNSVESILTGDNYRLHQRFLRGLENAPKKKGKGR